MFYKNLSTDLIKFNPFSDSGLKLDILLFNMLEAIFARSAPVCPNSSCYCVSFFNELKKKKRSPTLIFCCGKLTP